MSNPLNDLPEARLTVQEEKELAKAILNGDTAARQKLVLHTMREAISYARTVTGCNLPDSQLASACYDVLHRGSARYNPKYGRFFAFCKAGVRGYCRRIWTDQHVVKHGTTISAETPATPRRSHPFISSDDVSPRLSGSDQIWDDERRIAPDHEIFEVRLRDFMVRRIAPDHEISEPDFKGILMRERWDLVKGVMDRTCTIKERQVLDLAYIAGFNYQEVASLIGVSRAAIQGMAAKALRKIRRELIRKKRLFND